MTKRGSKKTASPAQLIDARIAELGGWRGTQLARIRALVRAADRGVVEEWKWRGVPVWSHDGIICTGETYQNVVKMTFAKGAALEDPAGLFSASLDGNTRRAIDIHEGEQIDGKALRALVRAAVAMNTTAKAKPRSATAKANAARPTPTSQPRKTAQPILLAGGNPQIAKAGGDAPVQAYIVAIPGWKRDVSRRLDALIVRTVPSVAKAVKWNSPFYGVEGQGWFLSFHVFTHYVKVTFFKGTSLKPVPPGGTSKDGRWIDIHKDDFDETQLAKWIRQAASLPGWGQCRCLRVTRSGFP